MDVSEESLLPEITHFVSLTHVTFNRGITRSTYDSGVSRVFLQPEHFFQAYRVQEIGAVGGHENLSAAEGVSSELFGEFFQEFEVKLILGFLNAEQGEWFRVVQEYQVGQHLDCTVGDIAGQEGIFECAVPEFQQNATFLSGL